MYVDYRAYYSYYYDDTKSHMTLSNGRHWTKSYRQMYSVSISKWFVENVGFAAVVAHVAKFALSAFAECYTRMLDC